MSDFSLFGLFTAGLACMIPFASAYTKPVGANPSGNPISEPGLNSLVPAGKPFEVTWSPTTQGTVTLVLLKGPSSDAEPLGVIAENIPNSGMYVWVPNTAIEPSANDQPDGYGIQLIVDATGQYQYTTQFGISNPSWKQGESWGNLGSSSSSSSAAASSTTSAANSPHPYAGSSTTSTGSGWSSTTGKASSHWTSTVTSTKASTNGTSSSTASAVGTASTGWAPHNSTLVTPTKPMTVPSTLRTTHAPATITSAALSTSAEAPTSTASTSSTAAPHTNGAAAGSGSAATSFLGFVVAAGVAMFAL